MRVDVQPDMLRWARERATLDVDAIIAKFARYADWEDGGVRPTMKQLEKFARMTRTPIGYFFLEEPPEEPLPIPDFRTLGNQQVRRPGPDLLEMIYICQRRQDWYRDYCRSGGYEPLPFVGSVTRDQPIVEVAATIRATLGFDLDARRRCSTWEDALRLFVADADDAGVMVMCSGVVLNNNSRKLKVEEFRGFALADDVAPLIFINGSDTKSAQMFTLAHELAHLWLGQSAVSTANLVGDEDEQVEQWCNAVAAEMLVPLAVLREETRVDEPIDDAVPRLARRFKVSTLVILRRLWDLGTLTRAEFRLRFDVEAQRLTELATTRGSGGNFYLSQAARLSKRFARAVVESTLEGQTLYRDAMKMVGVKKVGTFHELGRSLDFPI